MKREDQKLKTADMGQLERFVSWRECDHRFYFYFGPTMVCRYCGAQTIASVDGKSKPIFPPIDLCQPEAS